jgi:hypothetical protein
VGRWAVHVKVACNGTARPSTAVLSQMPAGHDMLSAGRYIVLFHVSSFLTPAGTSRVFCFRPLLLFLHTYRWSLLTSLLAFLVSVCGRLFLEFRLLERKRLAVTALLLMGSLLCFLVSHVNSSLHCWESLGGMTMEVVQLIWARIDRPLTCLAVIMASAGTVLGAIDIYLAINNPNVAEEDLQARKAY